VNRSQSTDTQAIDIAFAVFRLLDNVTRNRHTDILVCKPPVATLARFKRFHCVVICVVNCPP
jgi:hypothetical protein